MKRFTVIYSSQSIEALEKLIEEFLLTFNIHDITINDMFWYGVFCNVNAYANFNEWEDRKEIILIPTAHVSKNSAMFARAVMKYENPDSICIELDEERYEKLGKRLIEFLYSPNLMSTLMDC